MRQLSQGSADRHALAVVAAAYRPADRLCEWLAGVMHVADRLLARGYGIHGMTYGIAPGGRALTVSSRAESRESPEGLARVAAGYAATETSSALVRSLYMNSAPIATVSELWPALRGHAPATYRPLDMIRTLGFGDVVGVTAYDPSRIGVMLYAPLARRQSIDPTRLERWRRIRAHLLAGLRLQHALVDKAQVDAVLEPPDRIVHAERPATSSRAQEALRKQAREIEAARTAPGRRDPGAALAAWRGLVEGRWSVLDQFDSDGRRYFVARRNAPGLVAGNMLSRRERQVLSYAALGYSNQEIAYTLGLAPSTVSTHLRTGMRRLGVDRVSILADLWTPG